MVRKKGYKSQRRGGRGLAKATNRARDMVEERRMTSWEARDRPGVKCPRSKRILCCGCRKQRAQQSGCRKEVCERREKGP